MGEASLADAGYYTDTHIDYDICDWKGTFTGKDGVYSKEDFLNNPQAQENALNKHKKIQWQYFINHGYATDKYLGKTIDGIKITPSSMLGGAHLGGHGKVEEILRTNGKADAHDAFNSSVKLYMRDFQDYDVTEWTGQRYRPDGRILSDEELAQF